MKTFVAAAFASVIALQASAVQALPVTKSFYFRATNFFDPFTGPRPGLVQTGKLRFTYDDWQSTHDSWDWSYPNPIFVEEIDLVIAGHRFQRQNVRVANSFEYHWIVGDVLNGYNGMSGGTNDFVLTWHQQFGYSFGYMRADRPGQFFQSATVEISDTPFDVPEPATLGLLGVGAVAVVARRRTRQARA